MAVGTEDDLRAVLQADEPSVGLLRVLQEHDRPEFDVMPPLGRALLHSRTEGRVAAVEQVKALSMKAGAVAAEPTDGAIEVRGDVGAFQVAMSDLKEAGYSVEVASAPVTYEVFNFIGALFLRLLKMIIVPLVLIGLTQRRRLLRSGSSQRQLCPRCALRMRRRRSSNIGLRLASRRRFTALRRQRAMRKRPRRG